MQTLQWLLQLSRPRFWMYLVGPFLVGLVAGLKDMTVSSNDYVLIVLLGLFFTFPANFLIYGLNDLFDYETDKHNPKKKDYEILLEPKNRKKFHLYLIVTTLPFIVLLTILFLSQNMYIAFTGFMAFLFFGKGYSAPPIRAKTKPFLDSFFNILYIFPGVTMYAVLVNTWPPVHVLVAATLWTMAMHAFSAVPDIHSDTKAGLKTIATVLGRQKTIIFCALAYMLAAALVFGELGALAVFGSIVYTTLMVLSFWSSTDKELFSLYKLFPYVNVSIGFLLFWYVVIVF